MHGTAIKKINLISFMNKRLLTHFMYVPTFLSTILNVNCWLQSMKHVSEVHFNTTTKHNQFFLHKIPPEQACTTPVLLPAETLHITKVYVTLSLLRPTQKAEELSKTVYLCGSTLRCQCNL